MSDLKSVPEGISSLMPMLVCRDAAAEIDFCRASFDAVELNRRKGADGATVHALMTIGAAAFMIEGEWNGIMSRPPAPDGSSPVVLYLYVPDVDATVRRAVDAGAKILIAVEDRFWGDRTGRIVDPSGHVWTISSRVEETTAAERSARWSEIATGE